jgi:hypothetical protein
MKIRIKDNSLRFRLTKSEVHQLCTTGSIQSTTAMPSNTLTYMIKVVKDLEQLTANFIDHTITLNFPASEAAIWNDSDRITYLDYLTLPNGDTLKLLLEKDFVCLDHSDEDQSDNYENPNITC